MAKKQIDLGLTGLDELFMDDKERAESKLPKIHEIPLSEIDEFPDHPFHVRLDEDMDQLVESIKERGIITPVTLRQKPDGRYEIVSGHRRTKACELAGLTTVKAEIKELSRDEAIILMVESNLQRTTILLSEKAFSYKMRLEAMNRQGQRTDLTSVPLGQKLGKTSREVLADSSTDSNTQIQRYCHRRQNGRGIPCRMYFGPGSITKVPIWRKCRPLSKQRRMICAICMPKRHTERSDSPWHTSPRRIFSRQNSWIC